MAIAAEIVYNVFNVGPANLYCLNVGIVVLLNDNLEWLRLIGKAYIYS